MTLLEMLRAKIHPWRSRDPSAASVYACYLRMTALNGVALGKSPLSEIPSFDNMRYFCCLRMTALNRACPPFAINAAGIGGSRLGALLRKPTPSTPSPSPSNLSLQ